MKWRSGICGEKIYSAFCFFKNRFFPFQPFSLIFFFIFMEPFLRHNFKSGIFQTFIDADTSSLVYISGTGASFDCSGRTRTKQRKFTSLFERKQMLLIFQKDNPLFCCPARNFPMKFLICFRFPACCSCKHGFFSFKVHVPHLISDFQLLFCLIYI